MKGLEGYLKFLLSDSENIDDNTEIVLAARIHASIKDGRLKLLSLPDDIDVPVLQESDEYDVSAAAKYFEGKANDRNCGRMVFISDWRRLKLDQHQLRTTMEIINNINVFVTTVDGVLKIATYAAKQA
jgi:hypothetical protein